MGQNKVEIVIAVDSKTGEAQIIGLGNALEQTGKRGKRAMDELKPPTDRFNSSAQALTRTVEGIAAAFGVWELAGWAKDTVLLADTYQMLDARLKLVTKSAAELADIQLSLFNQSQAAGVSYANTVELYARLARSTENLNVSQTRLLDITDLINKAMIVSGASAQEAGAALIQLSQGLASGALRGDELRSVMEQTPRLTKAIADGLGVSIGELRKMGEEGELTAEKVLGAIEKSGAGIRAEFDQMPTTVGRAITQVGNSFGQLVDRANDATGATGWLAERLENVAHWLDIISGKSSEVTVEGLARGVKGQIADVEKDMTRLSGWLDSPQLSSVAREGVEEQIQDLAKELVSLNEELDYLRKPSDDPVKPLAEGAERSSKSIKELNATWEDYSAAMASTLSGEAAEIDKITKSYDARREAVEAQYKGQVTSQKELNDLAAIDAAEQRDLAAAHAKTAADQQKIDDDHLKKRLDQIEKTADAVTKSEELKRKEWAETAKFQAEAMDDLTTGVMTDHQRKVYEIEKRYAALEEKLVDLVAVGRMTYEEADVWQDRLKTRMDQDLRDLTDTHKTAAEKVVTVWDSALTGMDSGLDEWTRNGEMAAASVSNAFGGAIRGIVADWLRGVATMNANSPQMKSIGGTAAVYSTMAGTDSGYGGQWAGGVGIANELFNPGSYAASLGSLQNNMAWGLEGLGFSDAAWGLDGMSSSAFGSATAGIGTFVTSLLAGQDFKQAAASGLGSATGAYVGSLILPGIGTILGSIGGSFLGKLFGGDDENEFTLGELSRETDNTWDRSAGFTSSAYKHGPGGNGWYAPIADGYVGTMNEVQKGFNDQVNGLKTQMSAEAWNAFAAALESQTFDDTNGGRWGVSGAQGAITGAVTSYAEKLTSGINTALMAALPVIAAELTGNNSSFAMLTDDMQAAIRTATGADSFGVEQLGQLQTYLAQITQATTPIAEIVATHGLSEYELNLRQINQQFDAYAAQLRAAKVDLAKYTDLERARAWAIEKTVAALTDETTSAGQALLHGLTAERDVLQDNVDKARTGYLELLTKEHDELDKLANNLGSSINAIRNARKALYASSGELLPREQQFSAIKAEMERQKLVATGSDPEKAAEALSQIQALSGEYLSVSKGMRTDWRDAARDLAYLDDLLNVSESSAVALKNDTQTQIDRLDALVLAVNGAKDTTVILDQARQQYETAVYDLQASGLDQQIDYLSSLYNSSTSIEKLLADWLAALSTQGSGMAAAGQTEQWIATPGTTMQSYVSTGGATAIAPIGADSFDQVGVLGKNGKIFNAQTAIDAVNTLISSAGSDPVALATVARQISGAAQDYGVSGADLERMMGWSAGSADQAMDMFGLEHFATGGSFMVKGAGGGDNLGLPGLRVSAGEMVSVSRPDVFAGLREEVRSLKQELAKFREESSRGFIAVAQHTEKTARVMGRIENTDSIRVTVAV